ncbi:MAG: sigma-70 family RNA polymerase sigma factor [Deltaproteobacteria bacterium]|nr:sigma-70 family RNA polymerase sigma factor [Deltaproteobacteria bacterium]
MLDELEIIRKIKAGDTNSYALLVERYHRPLLAYIFKIISDKDLVEDIGQEVFFNVYRSLNNFDENKGVPFSAWIFAAARNRCMTVLRQRQNRAPIDDLNEIEFLVDGRKNPEEHLLEREEMIAVRASLQQIPEPYKKTILMSLEGSSLEKIAASQSITLGTVKSRLFRAKERVKILVGAYLGCKGNIT